MRYIKTFEGLIDSDDYKNKILLIDSSGSVQQELEKILKTNLYLANNFDVLFCSYDYIKIHKNIDLNELYEIINNRKYPNGYDGMQEGINFIINNKLKGSVIIFSDGYFQINISKLPNDISALCTLTKPTIYGGECQIFIDNITGGDYYAPRDCKSMEEYEYRKNAKKYNL